MTAFGAEEQSKLKRAQTLRAQQLAAIGDWEDAVALNQAILAATPQDVAALNRLGKALSELGRYGESHEAYNRALDVDPVNFFWVEEVGETALCWLTLLGAAVGVSR